MPTVLSVGCSFRASRAASGSDRVAISGTATAVPFHGCPASGVVGVDCRLWAPMIAVTRVVDVSRCHVWPGGCRVMMSELDVDAYDLSVRVLIVHVQCVHAVVGRS